MTSTSTRRRVLAAAALLGPLGAPRLGATQAPAVVPGAAWDEVNLDARGWSRARLDEARDGAATLPPGAVFVAEAGRVVARWGDDARPIKISSIRKSLFNALIGMQVAEGRLRLDQTLAELGIDEDPPLDDVERSATLRMLLQSRSGIYRPYVGGLPSDRARMPARGSHAPGSFWYYNNWDFNVLGTLIERAAGRSMAAEVMARIAQPTGMQDLTSGDIYSYAGGAEERSVHPVRHMRMTARDLARFGHLYLNEGQWGAARLLPAAWIRDSFTAHSQAGPAGYGYLWWIDTWPGVRTPSYSARGALGKFVFVFPERRLVVVYLNEADFPDDAASQPPEVLARLPNVGGGEVVRRVILPILAAQPA